MKFSVAQESNRFSVLRESDISKKSGAVGFVLNHPIINISDGGLVHFSALVTLNQDGECRLLVKDKELELWQVRRKARYFEKDGQSYRALKFMDGDIASIVLAEMKYSHYLSSQRETWVAVPNADDEHDTRVDGDTTIELNLNTKPIQKKLSIKRCFRVSRLGNNTMECLEVRCR
jgi:hypothetical protein